MVDRGLAVRADEIDVGHRHAGGGGRPRGGVGERLAQQHVEIAELGGVGLRRRRKIRSRSGRANGVVTNARTCSVGRLAGAAISHRAASVPSALVPDSRPITRRVCLSRGQQRAADRSHCVRPGGADGTSLVAASSSDRCRSRCLAAPAARRAARAALVEIADDRAQRALVLDQQLARARRSTPAWCMTSATLARPPAFSISLRAAASSQAASALRTIRIARAQSLALVGRTSTIRPP